MEEMSVNGHMVSIPGGWVRLAAADDTEGTEARAVLEAAGLSVITILVQPPARPEVTIGWRTFSGLTAIREAAAAVLSGVLSPT